MAVDEPRTPRASTSRGKRSVSQKVRQVVSISAPVETVFVEAETTRDGEPAVRLAMYHGDGKGIARTRHDVPLRQANRARS
jgi:hypothetical protein